MRPLSSRHSLRHATLAGWGAIGDPKSFQPSWSESHIRSRRSCGPLAGSRCLRRSDSLPISKEIARVTSGYFIATVRPIGSTPTVFVDSIENVRRLKQDHVRDNRPQRRPTYWIQLSAVYGGRTAKVFRQPFSTSKICATSTCFTVDSCQIVPTIYCSWPAASEPLRRQSVSSCRHSTDDSCLNPWP
jgi:hypothetical protein